ncbi:MAG: hypothetical protein ABWX92_14670, partial [Mycetocola sp.]
KRTLNAHREVIRAELKDSGATILADASGPYAGTAIDEPHVTRMTELALPQSPGEKLTYDDVKDKTQLAGRIVESYNMPNGGYGTWAEIQWFVLDSAVKKYVKYGTEWKPRDLTPEQEAARVQREIEETARERRRAERVASAEVRDAWITQFLQRRTPPMSTKFVALSLTHIDRIVGINEDSDSLRWLKVDITPGDDGELDYRRSARRNASPSTASAEKLILAVIFEAHEQNLDGNDSGWNAIDRDQAALYLEQLKEWGYGLSTYEQSLVEEAAAA